MHRSSSCERRDPSSRIPAGTTGRNLLRPGWLAGLAAVAALFLSGPQASLNGQSRRAGVGSAATDPQDHARQAIVVGIATYPQNSELRPLKYSVADAQDIAAELKKQNYAVVQFLNEAAGADPIREHLSDLAGAIKDGTVLFYFAGHGIGDQETMYLATHGVTSRSIRTSGLRLKEVDQLLEKTGAKRRVMWIDACRDFPEAEGARSSMPSSIVAKFVVSSGTRVLYSTGGRQRSYEYDDLKHGVFTHFLLLGLQGGAAQEGIVSFNSLGEYVTERVRGWSEEQGRNQVPQMGGEHTGDFLIARHTSAALSTARPPAKPTPAGLSTGLAADPVPPVSPEAAMRASTEVVRRLHQEERWPESLPHLNRLIADHPNAPELLALRSHAYSHVGRVGDAITDGEQAVRFGPKVAEAWLRRGEALMGQRKLNEAIADFDESIKLKPNDAETWLNKGASLAALNQNQQAFDCFSQGLKIDGQRHDLWGARGSARVALGQHKAALDDYSQAIRLKPRYASAFVGRAFAQMQLRQLDAALEDVNQALRIEPDDGEALAVRGAINYERGRREQAREDLTYALKLRPEMPGFAELLRRIESESGGSTPPSPVRNVAANTGTPPPGPVGYARLLDEASAAMRASRPAEANELIQQMIQTDPSRSEAYTLRGNLAMNAFDNLPAAYESYQNAIARGGAIFFRVAHDHSADVPPCFGNLTITTSGMTYSGETGAHQFQFPYASITEAAINQIYGSAYGMFHIKAQSDRGSRTFNFVVVRTTDPQIMNRRPDAEMLLGFVNRLRAAPAR